MNIYRLNHGGQLQNLSMYYAIKHAFVNFKHHLLLSFYSSVSIYSFTYLNNSGINWNFKILFISLIICIESMDFWKQNIIFEEHKI